MAIKAKASTRTDVRAPQKAVVAMAIGLCNRGWRIAWSYLLLFQFENV